MRISKINVAGFKSFVDPTSLLLPETMTGIVGPNGCGKSNIIDAIMWVMGESSAKHLRGDSMADVIFNGSTTRKPVGQATVELIFDNADGVIGGQYASYAEISIKRSLGRDAISTYFLNGVRCRRKDITGLFLGTGLGARSYSVIEQGTITRVIEAKPEELRVFLEEAAGISKYKERRRETENRIRHTNENLSRLNDIRDELEKQLTHLQRQARAAERFRELKERERVLQGELLALRWRTLDVEGREHKQVVRTRETAVEAAMSGLRSVETAITRLREQQTEATERFNKAQNGYYAIGGDISRLEQGIQHGRERRETLEAELARSDERLRDASEHVDSDEQRLSDIVAAIALAEPQRRQSERQEKNAYQKLTDAEGALQRWQENWDTFNDRAAQASESHQVDRARLEHLEGSLASNDGRISKLADERAKLSSSSVAEELRDLQFKFGNANDNHTQLNNEFESRTKKARDLRKRIDTLNEQLAAIREQIQTSTGRLASLEALQQAALGTDQETTRRWLQQNGLDNLPRLHELFEVETGWEAAVAMVVSVPLDAVCVASLEDLTAGLAELSVGHLNAVRCSGLRAPGTQEAQQGVWLKTKIKGRDGVELDDGVWDSLLNGVYASDDIESALRLWPELGMDESVVTPDGVWAGPGWLRVARPDPDSGNVLTRAREIKILQQTMGRGDAEREELARRLESARGELQVLEDNDSAASILKASHEQLASLRSELAAKQTQLGHVHGRLAEINNDFQLLDDARELDQDVVETIRQRLEIASQGMATVESERDTLSDLRAQVQQELVQARERWRGIRDEVHAVTVQLETLGSQRSALEQSLQRYRNIIEQAHKQSEELRAALVGTDRPEEQMQNELATKLRERLDVEKELTEARESLSGTDESLLAQEQARSEREQVSEERRDELEQARVDARALEVRLQDVDEQLQSSGYVLVEILAELPENRDSETCAADMDSVERRITRLGAINLAAIEEYDELNTRKQYLESQYQDLREALDTLQAAIRKIDKETRTKFKETYDKVNAGLQEKFPVLFGGGHAYLELSGDDLLETGVTVMARPPGKRNSTIHLLSGGEKALTALALVFAIFELNPAPFCLLDEVDAPLDDVNVVRYCDLLRSMAGQVQFIFITHNKITMEIAERLIGVTMHEAGVSRFVAVDMDEAVEMAAIA